MGMVAKTSRMDDKKRKAIEYNRKYYEDHKEAIKARCKKYYEENRETMIEKQREYKETHKEALAAYRRKYYEANKGAVTERKRNYYYRERGTRDDIRWRRKDLRMSQSEVAKRAGASTSLISMIELGRVKANAEIMREIYHVLGMEA